MASGSLETKALENDVTCVITDWKVVKDSTGTKATLTETLSGEVGIFGYNFTDWSPSVKPDGKLYNVKHNVEGDQLIPDTKVLWNNFKSGKLRFYAYAPYGKFTVSGKDTGDTPYLEYTVPASSADQYDVLYAVSEDVAYGMPDN